MPHRGHRTLRHAYRRGLRLPPPGHLGGERVVGLAQAAFDSGDYRGAATLLDHAVFTDAEHGGARSRYGDTLEQLGYGAENGTWRNFFLSGATELRDGNVGTPAVTAQLSLEESCSTPWRSRSTVPRRGTSPCPWT